MPPAARFAFGPYEVDLATRRLLRAGQPLKLPSHTFELLVSLLERRERVVSKAELIDLAWPRQGAQQADIAQLQRGVNVLRRMLGDEAIATVPGRGYRFNLALADEPQHLLRLSPSRLLASDSTHLLPGDLPRPALRPLLGREADLAALSAMLPERRLLSVVGREGVGKSQLVAHTMAHRPGVAWIDLSRLKPLVASAPTAAAGPAAADMGTGLGDAAGSAEAATGAQAVDVLQARIAATVMHTLGARHMATNPLADLCNALRLLEAPGLWLVFDETTQSALPREAVATVVRSLLHAAAPLRVLLISPQALETAGESVYRLQPLPVPQDGADATEARQSTALRLLLAQARRVDRHFELDLQDDAACTAACQLTRHLDGLPMALELAGARLPMLGAQRLMQELQRERQRLGSDVSAAADGARQSVLRQVMAWTLKLLSADAVSLLQRLARVADKQADFTLDELTLDSRHATAVADTLDALVDLAVVQVLPAAPTSIPGQPAAGPPAAPELGSAERYRVLGAWRHLLREAGPA